MLGLEGAVLGGAAGLAGGIVLGLAARIGRFCAMGALEDAVYGGDLGRLRMISLAASVAIAGTALAAAAGAFDPGASVYLRQGLALHAAALGGLMFGVGMALVGTCGFGALARVGGGDLRALVMTMVLGITAYATAAGPLAPARLWIATPGQATESLAAMAAAPLGLPAWPAALVAAGVLGGTALLGWGAENRRRRLGWGIAAGLTVPFAWIMTTAAGSSGFDIVPVESFTFTAPLGEALLYAMAGPVYSGPGFALMAVAGVVIGAALGSLSRREFRWEACDDARELRRQMLGAAMMGFGGVLALGCTIGQGLSALSVLSPAAPVVILSIMAGARLGLYLLVEGLPFRTLWRTRRRGAEAPGEERLGPAQSAGRT